VGDSTSAPFRFVWVLGFPDRRSPVESQFHFVRERSWDGDFMAESGPSGGWARSDFVGCKRLDAGVVTIFIRLGSNSWTPSLSLSTACASGSYLILSGSVTDYSSDRISVYAAFDGNFAELGAVTTNRPSGSSFDASLFLSDWYRLVSAVRIAQAVGLYDR
jgi:hypothetical protein